MLVVFVGDGTEGPAGVKFCIIECDLTYAQKYTLRLASLSIAIFKKK